MIDSIRFDHKIGRGRRPRKTWLDNIKDWIWLSVDDVLDSTQDETHLVKWSLVVAKTSAHAIPGQDGMVKTGG